MATAAPLAAGLKRRWILHLYCWNSRPTTDLEGEVVHSAEVVEAEEEVSAR